MTNAIEMIAAERSRQITEECYDAEHDEGHAFEITDEMVERLARAFFAQSKEGRDGFTWPLNGEVFRERDMAQARRTLEYVLTGAWPGETPAPRIGTGHDPATCETCAEGHDA